LSDVQLPESARTKAYEYLQILEPKGTYERLAEPVEHGLFRALAGVTRNWLHVDAFEILNLAEKVSGEYILIRKSAEFDTIVIKSHLSITLGDQNDIIYGKHTFFDRLDRERISSGFFIPVKDNIYGIFSVEGVEALEIFGFSVPPIRSKSITQMTGLTMSIDLHRVLLSAKTLIEIDNPSWHNIPSRFSMEDEPYSRDEYLKKRVEHLDKGKCASVPR
jgi:hypothetical protein